MEAFGPGFFHQHSIFKVNPCLFILEVEASEYVTFCLSVHHLVNIWLFPLFAYCVLSAEVNLLGIPLYVRSHISAALALPSSFAVM